MDENLKPTIDKAVAQAKATLPANYNPQNPQAAGKALVDLVYALADGVSIDDTAALMMLIQSLMMSTEELKTDTAAAAAHILSGAALEFGNRQLGK